MLHSHVKYNNVEYHVSYERSVLIPRIRNVYFVDREGRSYVGIGTTVAIAIQDALFQIASGGMYR